MTRPRPVRLHLPVSFALTIVTAVHLSASWASAAEDDASTATNDDAGADAGVTSDAGVTDQNPTCGSASSNGAAAPGFLGAGCC